MIRVSIWCDRFGWLLARIDINEVNMDYSDAVSRWENEGGK